MEFKELIKKLEDEKEFANQNYVPIIRDKSAEFLYDYVKNGNFRKILEIGTAIGYSGSIMLGANDISLTTIEKNEKYYHIAKNTFSKLNFENNVEMYLGDAYDYIVEFEKSNRKFDMIFLDGAKGQYARYLPILTNLLTENGVILADNVLLHGMVESDKVIPHKKRTMVVNLRKYLELINSDNYETELIRLEDGLAITKVKRS